MIAGMTYYEICWYFIFYSFCGWVIEVIFHAVVFGKVINRGFLNGPLCPVYGFGMLAVLAVSHLAGSGGLIRLNASETDVKSLLLLFAGSMLFATLVELAAGWLLDMLFHMRWWDYSDKPFNFHGYICLEFSIIWGLSISAVMLLIQPMMERSRSFGIPARIGWGILAVMYALVFVDLALTVAAVRGLNRRLEELDKLQKSMRLFSDSLSRTIGESTIKTTQKIGETQVQAALAKAELRDSLQSRQEALKESVTARQQALKESVTARQEALKESVTASQEALLRRKRALEQRVQALTAELKSSRWFSAGYILKNVPELKHRDYRELLERLKKGQDQETPDSKER